MPHPFPGSTFTPVHLWPPLLEVKRISKLKKSIINTLLRKKGIWFERTNTFLFKTNELSRNLYRGIWLWTHGCTDLPQHPDDRRVWQPDVAGSRKNPNLYCFRWHHVTVIFPECVAWMDAQPYKSYLGAWPVCLVGAATASDWWGLTCPQTSISLCTPTIKASCIEWKHGEWCFLDLAFPDSDVKGKWQSDRRLPRCHFGEQRCWFHLSHECKSWCEMKEGSTAGWKSSFQSWTIKLKILKYMKQFCSLYYTWKIFQK